MQATVDNDEGLLADARRQASLQGKSLGALVEEGLRTVLSAPGVEAATMEDTGEALEPTDSFFAALKEIRDKGRLPSKRTEAAFD